MKKGLFIFREEKTINLSIVNAETDEIISSKSFEPIDAIKLLRKFLFHSKQVEIIDNINHSIYFIDLHLLTYISHPKTGAVIEILPKIKKNHELYGIVFNEDGTTDLHQKKKKEDQDKI